MITWIDVYDADGQWVCKLPASVLAHYVAKSVMDDHKEGEAP